MSPKSTPSTPSAPSTVQSHTVSHYTSSTTTAKADCRPARLPFTHGSKQSRIHEADDSASRNLLQHVERLHVHTPASINTLKHGNNNKMNSPTMIIPHRNGGGNNHAMLTPPTTPKRATNDSISQMSRALSIGSSRRRSSTASSTSSTSSTSSIGITSIDLDTSYAHLLGTGLWSKVYRLAVIDPSSTIPVSPCSPNSTPPSFSAPKAAPSSLYTPPSTPQKADKPFALPQAFAIKVAIRKDALPVFEAEAKILQYLQSTSPLSDTFIVPFYGLSPKNSALIFECCNAGTLESLISISSPPRTASETLSLFIEITPQLVAGLAFIHSQGVVHADVKTANILLSTLPSGRLQARFADFSASFLASSNDEDVAVMPKSQVGGGTWAFMAPELLSRDPVESTPTFASDVYALGVCLLGLLVGGDPFVEVAQSMFMLREAVKLGDVVGFACRQPGYERRIEGVERMWREGGARAAGLGTKQAGAASVESLVAGVLGGALKKKREARVCAQEWIGVVETAGLRRV